MRWRGRLRGERGSVTIEAMFAIGFLLIPAAALLAQLPAWVGTSQAAQAAAVEAARHVVLADTMQEGAVDARRVAADVIANHGIAVADLIEVTLDVDPAGDLQRGQEVTVAVTVRGNPIVVPWLGEVGNPFNAVGAATERVDDYRSFDP